MARVHNALEEHATALALIEEAIRERDISATYLATQPDYNPLRANPKFQSLWRRMNLQ